MHLSCFLVVLCSSSRFWDLRSPRGRANPWSRLERSRVRGKCARELRGQSGQENNSVRDPPDCVESTGMCRLSNGIHEDGRMSKGIQWYPCVSGDLQGWSRGRCSVVSHVVALMVGKGGVFTTSHWRWLWHREDQSQQGSENVSQPAQSTHTHHSLSSG